MKDSLDASTLQGSVYIHWNLRRYISTVIFGQAFTKGLDSDNPIRPDS